MTSLEIFFAASASVCAAATVVIAIVALYRRNQVDVTFSGVPVDKGEFERRMKAVEAQMQKSADDIISTRQDMTDKISDEVTKVHNRVNEVLAAVSNVQGQLAQVGRNVGEVLRRGRHQ